MKILKKIMKFILKLFKWSLILGFILALVGFLAGTIYSAGVIKQTPKITEEMITKATGGTTNMYDSTGQVIYSDNDHRRDYIRYDEIPNKYIELLLATENKNYWNEKGWSFEAILAAIKSKGARGGSTIEQQLIKNLVFSSDIKDRTIDRKIKEIWLASQMDLNFDKKQILEWYINLINMGEGSYGANTIAITYYGQSLKDLTGDDAVTLSKLATIAGLGQAPSAYNLYDNPELVEERRNIVLLSAYNNNKITEEQYEEAKKVPIQEGLQERFWRNGTVLERTKEHNAYVTSALNQIKELGYDLEKTPMQIYTALDPNVNSQVKSTFDNFAGYKDEEEQMAATIIDPNTGYVLAQYGGRNTEAFGLNRATQQTRSSGSSIKPFEDYGPAIEYNGLGTNYILDSSNYLYPGTNVVAHNFGGATYGNVTMAFALRMSLNTPAIRILNNVVGSNNAKKFLAGMNLDTEETYGDSTALGLNVSTEQMAAASATLANKGMYKKPQYITKLVFNDGSEKEIKFNPTRAMKESTAYILLKMMAEVPKSNGTATDAIISHYKSYSVKTGTVGYGPEVGWATSNDASDTWVVGTTKNVSIAIWDGYDSPNEYGHSVDVYAHSQQRVFKQLMLALNEGKDVSDWEKPDTVTSSDPNNMKPTDVDASASYVNKYQEPYFTLADTSVKDSINSYYKKDKLLKVEDAGVEKYKVPSDYKDVIDWQAKANADMLRLFNAYPNNPLYPALINNNAYYQEP